MDLQQVFYVSRAAGADDGTVVRSILAQSRRNNRRDDITGCLLFSGACFAQVLEGEADRVAVSLARIRSDARHADVRVLVERRIELRAYSDWSMGYIHNLDLQDELEALLSHETLDPDRIETLMARMSPDPIAGSVRGELTEAVRTSQRARAESQALREQRQRGRSD